MEDEDLASPTWVWVPDRDELFARGTITDYLPDGMVRVTVKNGVQDEAREYPQSAVENCNPAKFNKCDDMAELTHLNEPSVIYNLFLRYNDDSIYTYLGLFLVAINPYKRLSIYEDRVLRQFHAASHEDRPPPHIFAIAENTHRSLVTNGKDQSILVTGESGAGKTENTKKIIQYLSLISSPAEQELAESEGIHDKILRANPILESFGNAKTIKNNNSSRFGKFIKIFFDHAGFISGATIEYYLLEKSRVSHQLALERNYHIFYQLLRGLDDESLKNLSLSRDLLSFKYLSSSAASIQNVDDAQEFRLLIESFGVIGFSKLEIDSITAGLAAILHLGNIDFSSWKSDQASFTKDSPVDKVALLLGVSEDDFSRNLLKPKVKAGREFVHRLQKADEVKSTIDALAKHLYEKLFQFIIERINASLADGNHLSERFIGVLDIAGFEIFEINSFEQLCINYTNEKLQQFFNHHSFILEQSEYLREDIQWEYIDFGLDLQPTIDLIETKQPMGILEILNEQCIIPKATEDTFMTKLLETWGNNKAKQFKPNKVRSGFIIDHYAGLVEYNIEDWLQKNKDPVSENVLQLMPESSNEFMRKLFSDVLSASPQKRLNGPKLKTVTQKHKEQLSNLMEQLGSTEPHFVRCILPNLNKKANKFDKELVLNQLRCNGVLEGIRIARAGFPNKMTFAEFFARYSVLDTVDVFTKNAKSNCELILKHIKLDADSFRLGITKIFFKNGILGHLEELRDLSIKRKMTSFQSIVRGQLARIKIKKQIAIIQASQVVAKNFQTLDELVNEGKSPWLKLFLCLKPMLEDSVKVLDSKEMNESLKKINGKLKETETEKSALESENASLKERLNVLEDEIMKVQDTYATKMDTLRTLQREDSSRSSKLSEVTRQLGEIKTVSETLSADKAMLSAKLDQTERTVKELLEEIEVLKQKLEDEKLKASSVALTSKKIAELQKELEETNIALSKLRDEISGHKAKLEQSERTVKELSKVETEAASKSSKIATLEQRIESLLVEQKSVLNTHQSETLEKQGEFDSVTRQLKEAEKRITYLESELQEKRTLLTKESASHAEAKSALLSVQKDLQRVKLLESQLAQEQKQSATTLAELKETKALYSQSINSHNDVVADFEKLKHELQYNVRTKAEYSEQIASLKEQIHNLELKLQDKENMPPPSPKTDPNIMLEYVSIKAKLNEQSALIRTEKFENQKLLEEVRMLRDKLNNSFESPLKRSEARRSLAMGEDLRLSQMSDSRYAEELKSLRIRLQQEESNATRAENYAIELQKKLNRLQATRGTGNYTDYEAKLKESQRHIEELESKLVGQFNGEDSRTLSRSSSIGGLSTYNAVDFARIYSDINATLKTTRDELGKSKSEILRLKSLLRESEDELYEMKRGNMKTAIRNYEEQLAKLKVQGNALEVKLEELQHALTKYKNRSEEYFEKLELAESAVTISKRHELLSRKELEEKSTELKLVKEEIRASEKVIRQLRQDKGALEAQLNEHLSSEKRLNEQLRTSKEQITYLNETYGDRKHQIAEHKEEIRMLRDEVKFKLEKETEIIKENKRLTIENEELLRIKEEVLLENTEVTDENDRMTQKNEDLEKQVASLTSDKHSHERKLEQASKQIESLRELVEENGRQMEQLNQTNHELERNKTRLEEQVSDLQAQLANADRSLKIVQEHAANLEQDKRQSRIELDDLRSRWDNSDGRYKEARTENLVMVQENESLRTVNAELKEKVGSLETKLYSNEQLKYLESKVSGLNGEVSGLKHQIAEGHTREQKMQRQIQALEFENENKSSQMKKYNDENFNYQNMVGQYKGKLEFLYQENSDKDLRLKAQEREMEQLRERCLMLERLQLQG